MPVETVLLHKAPFTSSFGSIRDSQKLRDEHHTSRSYPCYAYTSRTRCLTCKRYANSTRDARSKSASMHTKRYIIVPASDATLSSSLAPVLLS